MDRIKLLGLTVNGGIGAHDHEKGIEQTMVIDVDVGVTNVTDRDALSTTVGYDQVADIARKVVSAQHHDLIETVALEILKRTAKLAPMIEEVTVRVEKPDAIPDARTAQVEVTRRRSDGW